MIRLAMIRVGSGERKEPIATRLGTSGSQRYDRGTVRTAMQMVLTLTGTFVLQQQTGRLAEANRTESRCHHGGTRTQELLRFMNVIDALASTSDVLRVDRADGVPSRTDAKYQRILF